MKGFHSLGLITASLFLLAAAKDNVLRRDGGCSWTYYKNSTCTRSQFPCQSGQCIDRSLYCNGISDCPDGTDERYCEYYNSCPTNKPAMKKCPDTWKCILQEWFCDGIKDCRGGRDEDFCDNSKGSEQRASTKAILWLLAQNDSESTTAVWGSMVDKSAVVLHLADNTMNSTREIRKQMAYEVSLQLLSRLARRKLADIPSSDLASYVNAFLVMCLDPRRFHGMNIVQELRLRADQLNYTNPYVLLSLCNAGETITESDKSKLIDTFQAKHRPRWTDTQAFVVMALACASRQPGNDVDSETLRELVLELKQHQYRNGTVENLQTTALVMQALLSAEPTSDPDNFDEARALQQMMAAQQPDGSFGSLMNTYYVLPVLNCRSLANISSDHCKSARRDEMTALEELANRSGPKIRVRYSLWIGNEKDLERHLTLRVPANLSFYGVMELAAEIDSRYRFDYVVKNRKPVVSALSGLQEDPEKGIFWFLYKLENGKAAPSQDGPADVLPKDNEHFVMWYRSGSWVD